MKLLTCKICGKPRQKGSLKCKSCQVKEYQKKQREKAKARLLKQKEKKRQKRENHLPTLKNKADKLFSIAIRLRDKKSVKSGSKESLQCSHIWSRSNLSVRWDMDNALTLTAGEHLYWWHKEPAEAIMWAKGILGEEKWKSLERRKNEYFKLTPQFLKNKIEELNHLIEYYETK